MELLLLILIGLFVWFVVRPAIILRRRWKQMQDAARRFYNQQPDGDSADRRSEPGRPKRKEKKIDATVGEYVEFTETTAQTTKTEADGSTRTTTVHTEEQVTDVTWEDLP